MLDRLEKPQFVIFLFAACTKNREKCRLRFEGIGNEDLEAFTKTLMQNYLEPEQ